MLGIRFVSTAPTTHVIHYRNGKIRREGAGLSFLYYEPTSSIITIPLETADLPFVFHEVTADFQEVTIQGHLSYRIREPRRLAGLLDFRVDNKGRRLSEDPEALRHRLVQATQVASRHAIQKRRLREALTSLETILNEVQDELIGSEQVEMLGVDVIDISLASVSPTPEMARALEAEAREELSREAEPGRLRKASFGN